MDASVFLFRSDSAGYKKVSAPTDSIPPCGDIVGAIHESLAGGRGRPPLRCSTDLECLPLTREVARRSRDGGRDKKNRKLRYLSPSRFCCAKTTAPSSEGAAQACDFHPSLSHSSFLIIHVPLATSTKSIGA